MSTSHDEQVRGPSPVVMQRIIAAIALGVAFLVLGSVFAPSDSSATSGHHDHGDHGDHSDHQSQPTDTDSRGHHEQDFPPVEAWGDVTLSSTDPHEDLPVLGSLETATYRVVIYSTDSGPRYSVFEHDQAEPLGVLLDRQTIAMRFDDLPLPDIAGTSSQVMYTDPADTQPH